MKQETFKNTDTSGSSEEPATNFRVPDADLSPILNECSTAIEQLVNFGVKIIEWDEAPPGLADSYLPPILFLRNYIEQIDAISILIKHSSIDPCKALLRTALENIFCIEYLFQADTEKRSLAFLVWNSMNQQKWAEKADGESQMYKQLKSQYKKDKFMKDHSPLVHPEIDRVKNIGEQLLNHPTYSATYVEYLRTKEKIGNPAWYSLYDGPENMDTMAARVNQNASYEVLYRALSNAVHGNDILQGKLIPDTDGRIYIAQIRYPKHVYLITMHCFNFCISIFKTYIEKRIPGKADEYIKWREVIRPFHLKVIDQNQVKST